MLLPLLSRYRIWLLLFRYLRLCPPLFSPVLSLCFLLSAPSKSPRSVPLSLWTRSPSYQWAALPLSLAACTQRPHWNFLNPRKASFQTPRWNTLGHLGLSFVSPFSLTPVTVPLCGVSPGSPASPQPLPASHSSSFLTSNHSSNF